MVRISVAILLMSASFADARTVSDPWLTGAATGTPTPSATSSSAAHVSSPGDLANVPAAARGAVARAISIQGAISQHTLGR